MVYRRRCAACARALLVVVVNAQDRSDAIISANGRYCCKSLFALLIKNSPSYRRDVRVRMWGTSSRDDKLSTRREMVARELKAPERTGPARERRRSSA